MMYIMKQLILTYGTLHKNDILFCLTNVLLHVSQLLNNSLFNFRCVLNSQ